MQADAVVTLRDVTRENLDDILDLKVRSEQEKFVSSNAASIAEAHFYPETIWFQAIYADETPVGFVLVEDDPVKSLYAVWRFMIDARFQGNGFGKRALRLTIEYMKTRSRAKLLLTHCVPGEGSPEEFYKKMGFASTGEIAEDEEIIMQYEL
jgi:diamine N-acetyltransferase